MLAHNISVCSLCDVSFLGGFVVFVNGDYLISISKKVINVFFIKVMMILFFNESNDLKQEGTRNFHKIYCILKCS